MLCYEINTIRLVIILISRFVRKVLSRSSYVKQETFTRYIQTRFLFYWTQLPKDYVTHGGTMTPRLLEKERLQN